MPKGKRKDRQKSTPDSSSNNNAKKQRKMNEYLMAGQHDDDDDDSSDDDTVRKERKKLRDSDSESMLEQILDGQSQIQNTLLSIQEEFKEYREKTDRKLTEMNERQESLENALTGMEKKINYMERKQRERNLRLIGVAETSEEDCYDILHGILSEMRIEQIPQIEVAHRTGRRGNQPRHIIFRTVKIQDKIHFLRRQREDLRNKPYFFADDLTSQDYRAKQRLKPEIDKARRDGKRWLFREGQLYIEGQLFVEGSTGSTSIRNDTRRRERDPQASFSARAQYRQNIDRPVQRYQAPQRRDQRVSRYHQTTQPTAPNHPVRQEAPYGTPFEPMQNGNGQITHPVCQQVPNQQLASQQPRSQQPVSQTNYQVPHNQSEHVAVNMQMNQQLQAQAPPSIAASYPPQTCQITTAEVHQPMTQTSPASQYPPCAQPPPQGSHGVVPNQLHQEQWSPLQDSLIGGSQMPSSQQTAPNGTNVNLTTYAPDSYPMYASPPPAMQITTPPPVSQPHNTPVNASSQPRQPQHA